MNHATENQLLAYHDGEIDGSAAAALDAHLAACAQCAVELEELRRATAQAQSALSLMDVPAPTLRVRAAIAAAERERRSRVPGIAWIHSLGARSLAKAAVLLLMLAGAISAVIPGSPVRRALESAIARLLEPADEPTQPVVTPADAPADAPVAVVNTVYVYPVDGRVRVVVHAPTELDVMVRLTDDAESVGIETSSADRDVRFRSSTGRMEVSGLKHGLLRVTVPAGLEHATVEVDGRVYVYKQGAALHLSGPAGDGRGSEVGFRIGG